ncbi:hypothetical protein CEN40_11010, partial [Fischerella thermalis CCMEE 5205]
MTLSKKETRIKNKLSTTEQTLHSEIGDYIMQMFASPNEETSIEKQIDEMVNDFSEEFLITKNANTNVDIDLI